MTKPKAILFDLDGTLIHSAPDLHAAANVMLAGIGRDALDLLTIISFIGNGVEVLVERCLNATGGCDAQIHQSALERFLNAYSADMTTLTRPYPDAVEALETFRAAGIPLGICTNKPARPARDICKTLNLCQYFQLLRCCEQLGVSAAQVLYVGDSAIDFNTARNAGIRFKLYTNGYLNGPLPDVQTADRFSSWAAHGIAVN